MGEYVLFSMLGLGATFNFWLFQESDDERLHRVFIEHDKLVLQGKRKQAHQVLVSAITEETDGPLDPIWLPLVRATGNGYAQLSYLIRVIEAAPEREMTYKEIANLIEVAPQSFHDEVKQRYLNDLNEVAAVRKDYLEKYGLVLSP